jgi:hypothetical protein
MSDLSDWEIRRLREEIEELNRLKREELKILKEKREEEKSKSFLESMSHSFQNFRPAVADRNAAINEYITIMWRGSGDRISREQKRMKTNQQRVEYADRCFRSLVSEANEMSNEDLYDELEKLHRAGYKLPRNCITNYGVRRDLSIVETDAEEMDELVRKGEVVVRTDNLNNLPYPHRGREGLKEIAKEIIRDEKYKGSRFGKVKKVLYDIFTANNPPE